MLCYSYKFMRIRSKIANQHLFSTIFIVFFFTLSYLVLQFFYALLLCKVVFINISLFFLLSNTQINLKSPLTLFDEIKKKLKKKIVPQSNNYQILQIHYVNFHFLYTIAYLQILLLLIFLFSSPFFNKKLRSYLSTRYTLWFCTLLY